LRKRKLLNPGGTKFSRKKIRGRVAREAATLLYRRAASEFKQAKQQAASLLRTKVQPSNLEVALELDKIADEQEGADRREALVRMRKEALHIMRILEPFNPVLTGSVWRGTARRGSDIDIIVHSSNPDRVLDVLKASNLNILERRVETANFLNQIKKFVHIKMRLDSGSEAEVVVRNLDDLGKVEKCDIYGDLMVGLRIEDLEFLLRNDPLRKFVPKTC
jgi:predicted nucleotidyltransferase